MALLYVVPEATASRATSKEQEEVNHSYNGGADGTPTNIAA